MASLVSAGYVVLAVNPMSRRLGCWAGLEATDVVAVNSVHSRGYGAPVRGYEGEPGESADRQFWRAVVTVSVPTWRAAG